MIQRESSTWNVRWMIVYAIAMGAVEGAVVVYLRRLYFPEGFSFPLRMMDTDIVIVELWRELATLVMLVSVAVIAGRNRAERFAYFLLAFGVWDLAYYGFLKLALDWPQSWLTWDVLFLLPVPWVGPVIAPCIVAATMIGLALTTIRYSDRGMSVGMSPRELALLFFGGFVIVVSFILDWSRVDGPTLWRNIVEQRDLLDGLDSYVPQRFPWLVFAIGESIALGAWLVYRRRLERLRAD